MLDSLGLYQMMDALSSCSSPTYTLLKPCEFPIDSPDGDSSEKESDAEEGKAKEAEDDWIQYYYQLEDPHEFLIQKIRQQVLEDQQKQNELSKEIAEILSENAKIDAELEEKEKRRISAKIPKENVFVCFVCCRGFLSKEDMRVHIQQQHLSADKDRKFRCRFCQKAYKRKKNMIAHEGKHKEPGAVHRCPECGRAYLTAAGLEIHLSEKHSLSLHLEKINQKPYQCSHCEKSFGLQLQLKVHLQYCSRKEPIKAKKAAVKGRSPLVTPGSIPSSSYISFDKPRAVSSPLRAIKDKSCPECHLECASMQSRNRHIQRKHPEKADQLIAGRAVAMLGDEDLSALPFVCSVCERRFADISYLSIHKRRDHGMEKEKTFSCRKCGKIFPLASELRKHEKRMADLPMCRIRGRGFASPSSSAPSTTQRLIESTFSSSPPTTPRDFASPSQSSPLAAQMGIESPSLSSPSASLMEIESSSLCSTSTFRRDIEIPSNDWDKF